jgi:hypothetical protein
MCYSSAVSYTEITTYVKILYCTLLGHGGHLLYGGFNINAEILLAQSAEELAVEYTA